jgi:hypothetical protein
VADENGSNLAQGAGGQAARIMRTGIALVHEGELVLPAAGSAVEAEQVAEDARTVVHYHFPVEIEVLSAGGTIDVDAIVDRTLSRLAEGLENS